MYIGKESAMFGEPLDPVRSVKPERVQQVVRAIFRLPEGTTPVKPRDREHEYKIIKKLRSQGFNDFEIEAGLRLTRDELGLPQPIKISLPDPRDRAPRMGPAQHSKAEYDRALARHLDFLYARASMGDAEAWRQLAAAIDRLLRDRERMRAVGQALVQMRSPAAIILRVPPEPAAPTPNPPLRWRLPPRLPVRR